MLLGGNFQLTAKLGTDLLDLLANRPRRLPCLVQIALRFFVFCA